MAFRQNETFICPEPVFVERITLAAAVVNRCRLLRIRTHDPHVFVPIRSMQFQAVLADREVLFIDHQGGYAIENGIGGRLVALRWDFARSPLRDSLSGPVAADLVGYRDDTFELHRRIMSELPASLDACLERTGRPRPDAPGPVPIS